MKRITIYSRAKINLGLNILRKREDGFHDIETIFYPLQLCDLLHFHKSDAFGFTTDNEELNQSTDGNLIVRACKILEEYCRRTFPVRILLEKKIPMGAGLGGGSSNAAMTLLSMNELFDLKIPETTLAKMAAALGSDVPFFLKPGPALGTGRGEKLVRINLELIGHLVLVYPHLHVSTAYAYRNVTPMEPEISLSRFRDAKTISFADLRPCLKNDFEAPIFSAFPEIASLKSRLIELGAEAAFMSGSGSGVFGIFADEPTAVSAEQHFAGRYFVHREEL